MTLPEDRSEVPYSFVGRLILCAAAALAVVYIFYLILMPGEAFVHPDFHDNILQEAIRDGLSFHSSDFFWSFQPRAPGEFRPRFLAYGLMTIDQKIRLILDNYLLLPSTTLVVEWLLQIVLAPYLLYRLVVNLTNNRWAGFAGAIVYVTSIGFLSGIGMLLLQGKVLVNLLYIGALYLMSRISERAGSQSLSFYQVPGWEKYALLLVVFAGCFLDEMALFVFILLPALFPHLFLATSAGSQIPRAAAPRRTVIGLGLYALPGVLFLLVVLVIMPVMWRTYFDRDFDYLGNALVIGQNTYGAKSVFSGPNGQFGLQQLYDNFMTLFGMSLVPEQISGFIKSPFGDYPGTQINNAAKFAIFILAFGMLGWLAWISPSRAGVYLRRALVATALFLVFLCLVMIRQFPVVTGYYYGAPFAAMFALPVGLAFAAAANLRPYAQVIAAVAVLWIAAVQIDNFTSIQRGWRYTHYELVVRPRYEKQFKLNEQQVTWRELSDMWSAWRAGALNDYFANHTISTGAVYLAAELRTIDRYRAAGKF